MSNYKIENYNSWCFRTTSSNGFTFLNHDRKVSPEPCESHRVWRKGTLHGSCESFHFEKQGANGGVFGPLVCMY